MKLKNEYSLKELSEKYNCQLKGNPDTLIKSVCSLQNQKNGALSYILNKNFLSFLENHKLEAILVTNELASKINVPCLITTEPLYVFSQIIYESCNSQEHPIFSSNIGEKTSIEKTSIIAKNSIIGNNVKIGKNCLIYPNSTICDNTIIGDNVIIHPGVVIGSDGFGLVLHNKKWSKVPQIGNVIIESDVEIGANSTIDKAMIDSTVIKKNVKIDNQVHIAHNVQIGENTAIAACVGIAGSTIIGKNCTIGGGAGINGHIMICDDVHIHGMTMVTKSLTEPGQYASGTTVEKAESWRKNQARFKTLDELAKIIKKENGEKDEQQ
mgnify:CR=1 FL=1